MKIIFIENKSILDSNSQAIVNPVNCVGVAGKGLALLFKKHHYNSFLKYRRQCEHYNLMVGAPFVDKLPNEKLIIYFPTKQHYRDNSEYSYIEDGMKALIKIIKDHSITSISLPKLGCGLGQLNFETVYLIICKHLFTVKHLPITIYIYI